MGDTGAQGESKIQEQSQTDAMSFPKTPNPAATTSACQLVVVQDQLQPCPYRDGEIARMPLELPVGISAASGTDWLLSSGYRRSGSFVYTTRCPQCIACQPTRVCPSNFPIRKSFRRVLHKADRDLTIKWADPIADPDRVELFNSHRRGRDLGQSDSPVTLESYHSFLVDSCCQTMELSMRLAGELVGIAIIDVGQKSLSAVYTHFHPGASQYSIGTYAILKQILWAAERNFDWVYLGMFVEDNLHLNYKSRFTPQQRLIQGEWTEFN